jgi:hypothetical protein
MMFVKTFKGYEDRTAELDKTVNDWVIAQRVEVIGVHTMLSHEADSRARSGDLIYTVIYKADKPAA